MASPWIATPKAKALRLSNAHVPPLSPASCVLRSCNPNRYVAIAAMDATRHPNRLIALLAKRQHRHHQDGVSRRCGSDGAPGDVSRLAMLTRDVFIVATLVVPCSLSLTGWSLQCRRHGSIERLSIDFKLGFSACLFVDASSASCMPIGHAPSTTILKAKALRLANAHVPPLSLASCMLRSCNPNRYVATAAMDATWHQNRLIALLAKRQHHQFGVSRRCGGDGAPHDVSRLAMVARDVSVSSRHARFFARCPSQGGLFNERTATLSGCQLTSNSAYVRGLFVDASSTSCVSIEPAPSTRRF